MSDQGNDIALKEGDYQISGDRTSETIAAEIVAIREHTRGTLQAIAVSAAVEIGKRLLEAKSLVPYGEWGEWLKENLDYSERTAQNLMKLAEESVKPGFAVLEDLSYTKAVQLIGLPAVDREAFMEENDVEEMSVRELKAALGLREKEIEDMQLRIDGLKADRKDGITAREAEELKRQAEKAADDVKDANKRVKGKEKTIERLTEDLDKAKQVQLKDAEVMAKAKAEIPAAVKKELEELRENERQRKAAEDDARDAMKREGAEYTFRALYDQFKTDFERMAAALNEMDARKREKYRDATVKALEVMKERATSYAV